MRKRTVVPILVLALFLSAPVYAASNFDMVWVFSEVRAYDTTYFYAPDGHPYNPANPVWFIFGVSDTSGDTPYPVTLNSGVTGNINLDYHGLWGSMNHFSVSAFFPFASSTWGGPFPSAGVDWENKTYTFTVNGTTRDWFIPSESLQQLALPVVTITGDPLNPTISWNSVTGADHYEIGILPLDVWGNPGINTPLFFSNHLPDSQTSYTYNGDIFKDGRNYAVWVQARQYHPYAANTATYPDYENALLNRSGFVTMHSAYDAYASEDLETGWSDYSEPGGVVTFTPDNTDKSMLYVTATGTETQSAWGKHNKHFDNGIGMLADVQVTAQTGANGYVRIRQYIGTTTEGTKIRLNIRIITQNGHNTILYQI